MDVPKGSPVDELVKQCLLEERAGETEFTHVAGSSAYTLRWRAHNALGLVFVAVYQKILRLDYVDDLLDRCRDAFAEAYDPSSAKLAYPEFTETFTATLREEEARANARRAPKERAPRAFDAAKKAAKRNDASGAARGVDDGADDERDAGAIDAVSQKDASEGTFQNTTGAFDMSKIRASLKSKGGGSKGGGGSGSNLAARAGADLEKEKKEKKEKAPAPSKKVSAKPSSSAEKRKLGLGKANFSNMPRSVPKPKKERTVVEKVKPTYTFQRTGPADKEGFKSADRPYLKSTAPTKKQSLVTAIAGGVGVLITFVATRDPKYKNGQIDVSKTSDGKVDFPERTFEKKKWGGDGVTKTPAPRKKLFAKKESTTTAPKTTAATTSVSVVDNASDAGKWIDTWKKNSTTGGGGDSSSAASEASKWIEGWSQWSKDQVGGDATAPTEATADGRDSAEKWIAQWKADGSPTDESRKGDAKKWIDDWKNKTN